MRTVSPSRRTLPSRMALTFSFRAMVPTSIFCPLKEKDDVRAVTRSASTCESALISSSVMPSAKYSCCKSPLRLVNGSTAMECEGGAKAGTTVDAAAGAVAADRACGADSVRRGDHQILPIARNANIKAITAITAMTRWRLLNRTAVPDETAPRGRNRWAPRPRRRALCEPPRSILQGPNGIGVSGVKPLGAVEKVSSPAGRARGQCAGQ